MNGPTSIKEIQSAMKINLPTGNLMPVLFCQIIQSNFQGISNNNLKQNSSTKYRSLHLNKLQLKKKSLQQFPAHFRTPA